MKMDFRFRGHEFRNHPLSRARFEPRFSPVAVCLFILKFHANHFRISSAGYGYSAHEGKLPKGFAATRPGGKPSMAPRFTAR
jgi:hypothetical protein